MHACLPTHPLTRQRTHLRAHACMHARTHARTHARMHARTAAAGAAAWRREELSSGAVSLAINVAGDNHARALYNMMLAVLIIVLLLVFVIVLNYTIWRVRAAATGT